MGLDDVRDWHLRLVAELDGTRFDAGRRGPDAGRAKQRVCLSIDGPERLAELVVWESGEAQLLLGDVATGQVTDECLSLAGSAQLTTVVRRMATWVTGEDRVRTGEG